MQGVSCHLPPRGPISPAVDRWWLTEGVSLMGTAQEKAYQFLTQSLPSRSGAPARFLPNEGGSLP